MEWFATVHATSEQIAARTGDAAQEDHVIAFQDGWERIAAFRTQLPLLPRPRPPPRPRPRAQGFSQETIAICAFQLKWVPLVLRSVMRPQLAVQMADAGGRTGSVNAMRDGPGRTAALQRHHPQQPHSPPPHHHQQHHRPHRHQPPPLLPRAPHQPLRALLPPHLPHLLPPHPPRQQHQRPPHHQQRLLQPRHRQQLLRPPAPHRQLHL
mmetsp:Transcript_15432/g.36665  ORF Transcript_15432/g.36665 Transcript_15432/m.36665 type:complete len:209 (-) Transcript_15432:96-722(-)